MPLASHSRSNRAERIYSVGQQTAGQPRPQAKEPMTRITGIGEILMDVFEAGNATVGGAPYNVAFQAHQLLTAFHRGHGSVVSAVGTDKWGGHILSSLTEAGISTEWIAVDPVHATGVATVLVRAGEAGFEIAPEAAWDYLSSSPAMAKLARESSAVAFGSLAQRSPSSGEMIRDFVSKVNGPRFYDVNLRQNTTNGVRGYSPEIIDQSCKVATILKCNEAELVVLSEMFDFAAPGTDVEDRMWTQMDRLRSRYGLSAVAVTRGAKGAMLLAESLRVQLEDSTIASDNIHPVGAGDAFSAGLLYGLTEGLPLQVSARLADKLASWVTQFESATPRLTASITQELEKIEAEGR